MKILVLSDIHNKKSSLQEALDRIERNRFQAIIVAGDLTSHGSREEALELMEMLSFARLFIVPGNLDSREALEAMEELNASIHKRKEEFNGMVFVGMGGGLAKGVGEIVFTEEEIEGILTTLVEENSVLVTHLPPKNSRLDCAGKEHIGSTTVRKIILEKKPSIQVCGHAHESRSTEWIDSTLCINPGPAKEGFFAIVETGKKPRAELV